MHKATLCCRIKMRFPFFFFCKTCHLEDVPFKSIQQPHVPLRKFWKQEILPWKNLTSYREVNHLSFIQRTERTQKKYQVYEQVSHPSVLLCPEQTSLVSQKPSFLMNPDSASGFFSTSCPWKPLLVILSLFFDILGMSFYRTKVCLCPFSVCLLVALGKMQIGFIIFKIEGRGVMPREAKWLS